MIEPPLEITTKTCIYCEQSKPLSEFAKHSHAKDNFDSRCRECVKRHTKIRNKLHKEAPIKPTHCECCGKVPSKWALDHDHETGVMRGWICEQCNIGLGQLGDDIEGL